jgi:putative ATP-binding cassette transporter
MQLFIYLLNNSKRTIIIAVVTGLLTGIASTATIGLINHILNSDARISNRLLIAFFGLAFFVFFNKAISQVLLARLGQNAAYELRMQLSSQILGVPLRQLEEIGRNRLLAALTDDIHAIAYFVSLVPQVGINVAIILGCLLFLLWLSPIAFLGVFVVLVAGGFSYLWGFNRSEYRFKMAREEQDVVYQHFQALTTGIKELKLHRQRSEDFLWRSLQQSADKHRNLRMAALTVMRIADSWGQLLYFLAIGGLLFLLPLVLEVDFAVLTGYILVVLYMMSPVEIVMGRVTDLANANVAFKKIQSLGLLLSETTSDFAKTAPAPVMPAWQSLTLAQATHTYYREEHDRHFRLGPIDLTFHPGELVFIIGGNGSGKSTLAKLLVGLYLPEAGEIRLGGTPINDENREWFRQYFTVVFSDFYLFDELLGLDAVDNGHITSFLRQLQLEHKVTVTNGVLSTVDLSQGQRKRLALLTAYLEDRPIYVFDEWASDQDPIFKEVFYTQILPELKQKGKTVLAITHDDKYFSVADRVVKLDYGQIEYDSRSDPEAHSLTYPIPYQPPDTHNTLTNTHPLE